MAGEQLLYGRKIAKVTAIARLTASPEPKFTRDLPEARRRQLIEATRRCLARDGLAGTSVRQVAAEAGVSPGLVRHHFAGMQDLVAETYRATGREIAAVLDAAVGTAGPSAEARLRAFVDASFKPPLLDPDLLAVWLAFWSLTRNDAEIRGIHAKVYAEYRKIVERLVAGFAAERRIEIPARPAALGMIALLDGLWLEHCLDPQTFSADEAARIAQQWVDNLARPAPARR
jgi:TetR/AcrR family transcriptional regulator, transcriptional repressor of bet genes